MNENTLGSKLVALKERSGLTLANIATAAGYRQASSIQRYFSDDYDAEHLSTSLAKRLVKALVGFGSPPITETDIIRLSETGFLLQRQFHPQSNDEVRITRRRIGHIEVHGTVPLGDYFGEAEKFIVITDPILYYAKPEHLAHRLIEGILISIDSMSPRYNAGDIVFYDCDMPPAPGQDVVAFSTALVYDDDGGLMPIPASQLGDAVVAKLVKRTRTTLTLAVHTPSVEFEVQRSEIEAIYPILNLRDFLPEKSEQAVYAKS